MQAFKAPNSDGSLSSSMQPAMDSVREGVDSIRTGVQQLGKASIDLASNRAHQLEAAGSEAVDVLIETGAEQLKSLRTYAQKEPLKVILTSLGVGVALAFFLRRSN